ncbi:MFS transporter [Paenibacillus filicis]|uniref:MFS transporter n=1 Tax=Paenibacillus filicis TaxID=669464 RepID=A0ABU9DJT0_9BACL
MIIRSVGALAHSTMATTFTLYLVAALGLNPLQLLIVGVVLEAAVLVFEGLTGVVADTYGRRISVIIGMFIVGSGFALQGLVVTFESLVPVIPMFGWLLLAQVLFGLGHTFISGAETAWVVDEVGEEKMGLLFLRANRFGQVASLTGIGIGVGLYQLSPSLPLISVGVLYGLLGLFLIIWMKETAFERQPRAAGSGPWIEMKDTWLSGLRVIRNQPVLIFIVIVTVLSGAASEGYDRLWGAHLMQGIGFPADVPLSMAAWFGIISATTAIVGSALLWIVEKRLDVNKPQIVAVSLMVLMALRIGAMVSFAFAPDFAWAIGAVLLVGLIGTLYQPMYETWLNQHIEGKSRATVLSMMGQSDALGQIGGGPLVGWVGTRWSLRASLTVSAVLLSPIILVLARVLRKR